MAQTLGEKLRQAREERGVSISEVAEQTRISPLYIESIEKDNYKPLPGGIFNKGFVKSYAKYVGLDEQEALRDYGEIVARAEENQQIEQPRSYRPEVLTDERPISAMMPTILLAGVILAVMSIAILLLVNYVWNRKSNPVVVSNTANVQPSPEQTEQVNTQPPGGTNAPAFDTAKMEFKVTDSVYLSSTVDGKTSETQVEPAQPAEFSPKDSLRLKYHISRANFVSLSINGRPIEVPKEPLNPKRSTIELEINKNNFPDIWRSGRYVPPAGQPVGPQTAVTPRPAVNPRPSPSATKTEPSPSPRPANAAPRPTR